MEEDQINFYLLGIILHYRKINMILLLLKLMLIIGEKVISLSRRGYLLGRLLIEMVR
jgi:hypothetical protein